MKKLFLIAFIFISVFAKSQDPVKLTNGAPAWIPNYLILDGSLYFRSGSTYTSLGDSLESYIRISDSTLVYYTPRQVDSIINANLVTTFTGLTDTEESITPYEFQVGNAAGNALESPSTLTYNDSLKLSTGNLIVNDAIISYESFVGKNVYVAPLGDTTDVGTWRHQVKGDSLMWHRYNGVDWDLVTRTYIE